jgi:hypothetical protein
MQKSSNLLDAASGRRRPWHFIQLVHLAENKWLKILLADLYERKTLLAS